MEYFQKFTGIVLFRQEYKEHDMIVKIFSREFGKQNVFCKKLTTLKSSFYLQQLYPLQELFLLEPFIKMDLALLGNVLKFKIIDVFMNKLKYKQS